MAGEDLPGLPDPSTKNPKVTLYIDQMLAMEQNENSPRRRECPAHTLVDRSFTLTHTNTLHVLERFILDLLGDLH